MEERKRLLNRKVIFISIGILILAAFLMAGLFLFKDNKHYKMGVKHLEAKNFDDAVSEFNLWIAEDENNPRAKGLLLYAKVHVGQIKGKLLHK